MDIVSRAKNMIMSPAAEWPVVASESYTVGSLYQGYIIQLAAIPPVATLIGTLLFRHIGFGGALLIAIVTYILGLIGVYVVAFIAGKLAPMFGGNDSTEAGLKLVAFGSTAGWVGGVFHIIPALGILSLLAAIYGIYLFYTGVTPVMNVPSGRVIGYLIALIVAVIVVYIVIFALVGAIAGAGMMAGGMM
ncbi:MAG TPA: Yip1 family protein [Stellaceae bacterium]|jgi:hypothetical protein